MAKFAFHVPIKAAPGQSAAVEEFLFWALPRIEDEPGTKTWYAVKEDDEHYAIFDTFDDEDGRQAHLHGKVGAALGEKTKEGVIFAEPPQIHKLTILADKVTL